MIIQNIRSLIINRHIETSVKAGMIATFAANDNDYNKDINNQYYDKVSISTGQNEYTTDVFEKSDYKINDFLYCSKNGKIINQKIYIGNIIIGIVNLISKDEIKFITCFSRYLETK